MSEPEEMPETGAGAPGWDAAAAPATEAYDYDQMLHYDLYIRLAFYAAMVPMPSLILYAGYLAFAVGDIGSISVRAYLVIPAMLGLAFWKVAQTLLGRHMGKRFLVVLLYLVASGLVTWLGILSPNLPEFTRMFSITGLLMCLVGLLAIGAHQMLRSQSDRLAMSDAFREALGIPFKRAAFVASVAQQRKSANLDSAVDWRIAGPAPGRAAGTNTQGAQDSQNKL